MNDSSCNFTHVISAFCTGAQNTLVYSNDRKGYCCMRYTHHAAARVTNDKDQTIKRRKVADVYINRIMNIQVTP